MKIYVGSMNPAKIKAVKKVFPEDEVVEIDVASKVSLQPFSDEETMEGAVNRARECASMNPDSIGIGLEGGVMELNEELYLCNWGALISENGKTFLASGARIPLPPEVAAQLEKGIELGEVMDEYAQRQDVRKKEGAIGIFTNELVSREEMFTHVMKLLKGQYQFQQQ
ncbi:DUF84 family protein [Sediminibacillus dalangtanensis]|uniref:inosine/xanthosine triphosphatase n=1 Tax=Sediminibacillus dalangtanensis TaxID=2729421 RepID=A0ABX7VUB2_9BACI|nr:DUF84 family protein [Sediminibacillus dalangtanensis]QTN00119.1 DUF84 family protein [Sediminibacillus dalangtanensis]